jgi:hypothetical protein
VRTSRGPDRPLAEYPVVPPEELPVAPPAGALGEPAPTPDAAPALPQPKRDEVAALQFLEPAAIERVVPLAFGFVHEGQEVRSVTVRRLSVAGVGAVMEKFGPDDDIDVYAFYAAMTGLPAAVLRGMIDDDGAEVIAAARPMLPRFAEGMFFGRTSAPGEA